MEVIAHRGATEEFPENTLPAFERAIELGAYGIELDVRLTSDRVPVVFHYFYLDGFTSGRGPLCDHSLDELRSIEVSAPTGALRILPLREVLDAIVSRTTLEIELKGPEKYTVEAVAAVLDDFRSHWDKLEITSYETSLLDAMRQRCAIAVDLLTHKSEPWMKDDFVAYNSVHRAQMAGARAVHLHVSQLSAEVVERIRGEGVDVHSYEVNDEETLGQLSAIEVTRFTTDRLAAALSWSSS